MQPIKVLEMFTSKYLECGEETPTAFKIEQKTIDNFDFFAQFLDSVKQLRDAFHPQHLLFRCEFAHEDSDFLLISDIDIDNADVKVREFEIESVREIPDIFGDANLVSKLKDFYSAYEDSREPSIDDLSQLIQSCFASGEITDIKMTFSFDKKDVLSQIPGIIPDDVNILIFISYKSFQECMKKISLFELKNVLLSDKNGTLLLIQGAPSSCFGDYFGMFDLGEVFINNEILAEFLKNKKNDIKNHLKQITETISAANLNFFFLPPQFFNFIKPLESNDDSITSVFYPALLFNLFISFSSFVNQPKNDCLKLTIDGRRIVFSRIEVIADDPSRFKLDGEIIDFARYSDQINGLYTFYSRVFGAMDTGELDDTKIFISKKIISIYSQTYLSFLERINDISDSTWSEYKFYTHERVDKFIEFKEQLTTHTFNQNKELIQFNTTLSETLSTTFFRITGFVLVFLIGLIAEANDDLGKLYLLIGPILLIFLILFSIYRIYGIKKLYNEHQKQHKSYIKYFMKYLDKKDIKELSGTINNSIFNNEYKRSIGVLISIVIICLIVWMWINFGSIDYKNIIINNASLQESFP